MHAVAKSHYETEASDDNKNMLITAMVLEDWTFCEPSGLITQKRLFLAMMADITDDTQEKPKKPARLLFRTDSTISPYLY